MNTFAQPTSGNTDPANEAIRNFHFNLAQIRELGLDHGVSEGVLARRMKDLTDDERALLKSKYSDEVLRILAQRSLDIGRKIILYADKIDDMADVLDKAIKDLEGLQPPEQHEARLKDLKQDKRELVNQRQELESIERDRLNANPETIESVESRFDTFRNNFDNFAERFRTRSYSNRFDINSMGNMRPNDDDDENNRRHRRAPPSGNDHDNDDPSADAA